MEIKDNITFNESNPLLSAQSNEFKAWYNDNFHSQIVEPLNPTGLDKYHRPISFINEFDGVQIETEFKYIFENSNSWACSDFKLTINII